MKLSEQTRKKKKSQGKRNNKKQQDFNWLWILLGLMVVGAALQGKHKINLSPLFEAVLILLVLAVSFIAFKYYRERKKKKAMEEMLLTLGAKSPMQLSPTDYERFCALLLERNGWKTELTKTTGDFGADIVAYKDGTKVVVQCKQWTDSVGVKAVQEVHSAIGYYKADKGIVVSTAGYTPSAKELAAKLGIMLLSHNDLMKLEI